MTTPAIQSHCVLGSGCRYPHVCTTECYARVTMWEQCPECRGHGSTKATLVCDLAMIRAAMEHPEVFGKLAVPIHKDECKTCSGTGKVPADWIVRGY